VAQHMHQPGFCAAAVHAADDVEDAERFVHGIQKLSFEPYNNNVRGKDIL
jgi:hypothetical protein